MGNCCSSIHKKKKRGHRRDDVYDPEDVNQKMIYETSSTYNPKKKEMTTFNTETVKAALEQVQHGQHDVEDEVEESVSSDEDDTSKQLHHSPKTKTTPTKGAPTSVKTAPLPKTVGMHIHSLFMYIMQIYLISTVQTLMYVLHFITIYYCWFIIYNYFLVLALPHRYIHNCQ